MRSPKCCKIPTTLIDLTAAQIGRVEANPRRGLDFELEQNGTGLGFWVALN